MESPSMKTIRLVLKKVDKQKYWGNRSSLKSLNVSSPMNGTSVNHPPVDPLVDSPIDPAHFVSIAEDVPLSNGIDKRKRLPKRMADGTLCERPAKRPPKASCTTPILLNQNANNNESAVSHDNHMTPVIDCSFISQNGQSSGFNEFSERNGEVKDSIKGENVPKTNLHVSNRDVGIKFLENVAEQEKLLALKKMKNDSVERTNTSKVKQKATPTGKRKSQTEKEEKLSEKKKAKPHQGERKKKKDESGLASEDGTKKKRGRPKKNTIEPLDNDPLSAAKKINEAFLVDQVIPRINNNHFAGERKKKKELALEDGTKKKRGRPRKNTILVVEPLDIDPLSAAKKITETFLVDQVISRINNNHFTGNTTDHSAPQGSDQTSIVITTAKAHVNEDSLSNTVQVQENIDNVLISDSDGTLIQHSIVTNNDCNTTCLQEGCVSPTTSVFNPSIFLSSPWAENSPTAADDTTTMDMLLDGTSLGCGSREGTCLGCGPVSPTLNGPNQDLYSPALTSHPLNYLIPEGSGTLNGGACPPPDTDETSIPFLSTLKEDNVKLNDCVTLLDNGHAKPVMESCIKTTDKDVIKVQQKIGNTKSDSTHLHSDSVHLHSDSSHPQSGSAHNSFTGILGTNRFTNTNSHTQNTNSHTYDKSSNTDNHTHNKPRIPNTTLYGNDIDHMYMGDESSSDQELIIDVEFRDILNKSEMATCTSSSTPTDDTKTVSEASAMHSTTSLANSCGGGISMSEDRLNVKKLDPVVKDSFSFNLKNLGIPPPTTEPAKGSASMLPAPVRSMPHVPVTVPVTQSHSNNTSSLFSMKNSSTPNSLFRTSSLPTTASFQFRNSNLFNPSNSDTSSCTTAFSNGPITSPLLSNKPTPISFAISKTSSSSSDTEQATSTCTGIATPTDTNEPENIKEEDPSNSCKNVYIGDNNEEDKLSLFSEDPFADENAADKKPIVAVMEDNTPSTNATVSEWLANSELSSPPRPPTPPRLPSTSSHGPTPPRSTSSIRLTRQSRWDVKATSTPKNSFARNSNVRPQPSYNLCNPPVSPMGSYPRSQPPPPIPPLSSHHPSSSNTPINHRLFSGHSSDHPNNHHLHLSRFQPRNPAGPPPPPAGPPLPPRPPPPLHGHTFSPGSNGHLFRPPLNWHDSAPYRSMFDHPLISREARRVRDLDIITFNFYSVHQYTPSNLLCKFLANKFEHADKYRGIIVPMMNALLDDNYAKAAHHYFDLRVNKEVSFNIFVLRPLLMLCSRQTAHKPVPCPYSIAQRIMSDLYELYCKNKRCDQAFLIFDHLYTMHTLANYNRINDLYETYKEYKEITRIPDHFAILLSKASSLGSLVGYRVVDILRDAIGVLNKEDMIKFSDQMLSKVEVNHLQRCQEMLSLWIESNWDIVREISLDTSSLLLSVLIKASNWSGALLLVEMFPSLSSKLLGFMSKLLDSLCNSNNQETKKRLIDITLKLTDEQIYRLHRSDWYTLLEFSLEVNQLQAAMWIYIKMNNFKISLDSKLTLKLLKMLVDNDSYQPAKNILRVFLSSSIELSQFTHVCEIFQKNGFSEHLFMICASMIDNKLPVPLHSLNWLLHHHMNVEKAYHHLADLIKKASCRKVVLSYPFYQQVLVEMRSWGRDMDALCIVYKCLQRKLNTNVVDGQGYSSGIDSGAVTQDTGSYIGSVSVSPLSTTSLSPPLYDEDSDDMDIVSTVDNTLEINENTVTPDNECDNLIKRSGAKEQFGNVAILLSELDECQHYSSNVLLTCVSVLVSEDNNGKCHVRYKQLIDTFKTIRKEQFNSHDSWLLKQMGVALIYHCESKELWCDGFSVLHSLHENSINYLEELRYPHAVTPPPSVCSIAMKAVQICMKANRLKAAMVILKECRFAVGTCATENMYRTEILLRVAFECVTDEGFKKDCVNILKAIVPTCPLSLHDKLTYSVLHAVKELSKLDEFAEPLVDLLKQMMSRSISVSQETCTQLIKQLLVLEKESLAKDLVDQAVKHGCYQLIGNNHRQLTIPMSLTQIETEIIVQNHLSSLPRPLTTPILKVYCGSESLHVVECSIEKILSASAVIKKCAVSPASCISTRLCLDISLQSLQADWSPSATPNEKNTKRPLSKKQEFKRILCAQVMKALQQYHKDKRFNNEESYKKLVSLVYQYFQQKEAESDFVLTNRMQEDIVQVVEAVMNQVRVYNGQHIDLPCILSH